MLLPATKRVIPTAAAAGAALTFGACPKDDDRTPEEELSFQIERMSSTLCEMLQRCLPADFAAEFENLRACVDYYESYYTEEFSHVDELAKPHECRRKAAALLRCYADSYSDLSCAEISILDEEGFCDEELAEMDAACRE